MLNQTILALRKNFGKILPMLTLLLLFGLAAGTDIFSAPVRDSLRTAALDYFQKLLPFAIDIAIGLFMVNVAWLFYRPVIAGLEKVLEKTSSSQRGKDLALKLAKFFYWAVVLFFVLTLTAAEVIGRFVIGFGVFGAALTLAMQGAANDFICGLLIQLTQKVKEGDNLKLEGLDVKGKAVSVGYLSSIIESESDQIRVPNREIWSRAVKVAKPKSSIILPSGLNKN